MVFGPTYGSPFVRGFDGERRYGTLEDLNNFHKLAYMAPALQNTGAVVCEPVDVPIPSGTCTSRPARSATATRASWGR